MLANLGITQVPLVGVWREPDPSSDHKELTMNSDLDPVDDPAAAGFQVLETDAVGAAGGLEGSFETDD